MKKFLFFRNISHLEWRAELSDTSLKGSHPGTIPARLGLIWFSGFRGEDLNVKVYDARRTDGRRDGRQDDDGCQVMAKAHPAKDRPGELKTHGEKTMNVNVNTKVSTPVT